MDWWKDGQTDPISYDLFRQTLSAAAGGPKIYLCTWQNVNNKTIPIKIAKNLSLFPPLLPWKKSDHLKWRSRVIHMVIQMRVGWFTYATPNVDHAADFKICFPLIYLWAKTYFKVIALLFFLNFGPDFCPMAYIQACSHKTWVFELSYIYDGFSMHSPSMK